MGQSTFRGDGDRKTIDEYPYNYNNTMIMKSRNGYVIITVDLPLLNTFVGESDNILYFGLVILESNRYQGLLSRHIVIIIQ